MTVRAESILGLPLKLGRWNAPLTIQPEQAKSLLEGQPHQRDVSSAHVDKLKAEIVAGRFKMTNEGLAFDEDGLLFDGQHRLWACFLSGFPVPVLCCFNEPRDNYDYIGSLLRRRTDGDHLVIAGVVADGAFGNTVSGAARFIWAYESGMNPTQSSIHPGWSPGVLRKQLETHRGLIAMAQQFRSKRKVPLPLTPIIALGTLMEEADDKKAAMFLHQVTSGEGLEAGSPALTLRESALARTATKRGFRVDMAYRIVRAWNAFYEERLVHRLYGSNAPHSETGRKGGLDTFPQVAGLRVLVKKRRPANAIRANDPPALASAQVSA